MASDSIVDTSTPTYEELLAALCDLMFAPSNVAAQLEALRLIDRVPVGRDS